MRKNEDNFMEVLHEFATGMSQIAESTEDLLTSAEQAHHSVNKGKQAIQAVTRQAHELHDAMFTTKTLVESLQQHSETIGKITNVITAIAEQTNLLALNAAIEQMTAISNEITETIKTTSTTSHAKK